MSERTGARRRVVGLVTAAGASERMGRPKAALPWGPEGEPLLAHGVRALLEAGAEQVAVTVGADAEAVRACVPDDARVFAVAVPGWREGRSASFQVAARALALGSERPAVTVVHAVDRPTTAELVRGLLAALARDPSALAAVPWLRAAGRRGHPVVLGPALSARLVDLSGLRRGLRDLLESAPGRVLEVPTDDPRVRVDLAEPPDYAAAFARFADTGPDPRTRTP